MDTGNTAWVLISTALVLFMTPGLAFFYGGMVRSKNVLGMLMQNFFAMGLLAILWVAIVFSLAFGDAGNGGVIGNFDYAFLKDVDPGAAPAGPTVPRLPDHPVRPVLRLPDDVRHHHARPSSPARPPTASSSPPTPSSSACGWCSSTARSPTGSSPAAAWPSMGALDFAGGAVVHINAGAARGRPGDHPRRPQGLPRDADAAAQPAAHDARHRHPVVRLGRVQRRLGARRQRRRRPGDHEHLPRRVGRDARLAARRADPERPRHDARRRLGCRRRPRRHHALRRLRRRDGADLHRPHHRRGLLPGPRHQAGVQARRQPRRDRRAPRRRSRSARSCSACSPTRPSTPSVVNEGLFLGGGLDLLWRPVRGVGGDPRLLVRGQLHHRHGASHKTIGLRVTPAQEEEGLDLAQHAEQAYAT